MPVLSNKEWRNVAITSVIVFFYQVKSKDLLDLNLIYMKSREI